MLKSILDANNVVVNTIILEEGSTWQPPEGFTIGPDGGSIGDTWNGTEYVHPVTPIETPAVPAYVSNYQGRAALINANLFDTVNTYVTGLGTTSLEYQAWEYATNFYRDSPFIASVAAKLGLSSDQVDQLFIAANNIN